MKKTLRKEVLKKRDAIPPDVRKKKDALIKENLLSMPEFISARTVLFYASFRSEAGTFEMMTASLGRGKRIVLPKVDRERHMLRLYEVKDVNELSPGHMGIPEPSLPDERMISPDDVDLIVIPGAGFDIGGNRIGYGEGYYDILLSQRRKKMPVVALAYEEQVIDSIPAEAHDVKVDMIITDKRVIRT
jgi:5-formyltetrahydrofolate cyclo-ligase